MHFECSPSPVNCHVAMPLGCLLPLDIPHRVGRHLQQVFMIVGIIGRGMGAWAINPFVSSLNHHQHLVLEIIGVPWPLL